MSFAYCSLSPTLFESQQMHLRGICFFCLRRIGKNGVLLWFRYLNFMAL